MSDIGNRNKDNFLGMPFGTACHRLRKLVLFALLEKHNENICYRCGDKIETADDLSIEHKKAWLNVDKDLFWNLDNISFSHTRCNYTEHTSPPRPRNHGRTLYDEGCRCEVCVTAGIEHRRRYHNKPA